MNFQKAMIIARQTVFKSGGLCATLASVQPIAPTPLVSTILSDAALASGGVTLGAGLIWAFARSMGKPGITVPGTMPAETSDLPEIRKIAERMFGDKVTSLDLMRGWTARYPGVIAAVTLERRNGTRRVRDVVGYFCALPLGERATEDLLAGRRGVNDIQPNELSDTGAVPSAVYVGAVATKSEMTRGVALHGLRGLIRRLAKNRQDVRILTRPVTEEGLELVGAFGLQPVQAGLDNGMGVIHVGHLGQLIPRRTALRRKAIGRI